MAKASVVVSLKDKPKKTGPTEHFIRLSRGEGGGGFTVGYFDGSGVEDFRSQELHNTYDEALKAAQKRAYDVRRPLKDVTGVEPEPAPAVATKTIAAPARTAVAKSKKSAAQLGEEFEALPNPFAGFRLPALDIARHQGLDPDGARAFALFRAQRAVAQETNAEVYGQSRDYACTFTQATYDQLQSQIAQLYMALYDERATSAAYLEAAFDRIAQLEAAPKGLTYRGIYHQGDSYEPQDCVTWGGSMWVAKRQTTDKPGETEGDDRPWTLACKKGRDGKDLRNAA